MKPAQIVEVLDSCLELQNGNRVYTSLEGEHPGGSVKDHMVCGELDDLIQLKKIQVGDCISEVSSGSTANSLAYYCPQYGLKCVLFVPIGTPQPTIMSLTKMGAEIHVVEMKSIYAEYDEYIANNPSSFRFDQLFDSTKRRHYRDFGTQVKRMLGPIDAIVGGVGTGHSLLGVAEGMGSPFLVSAEPQAPLRIPGVRNIELERYGDRDSCRPEMFDRRIIISQEELLVASTLQTSEGLVQVSPSFLLALSAVKKYLVKKNNFQVFTLGSSIKRMEAVLQRAA